jgi:predicted nuclease with TOPRIM domain
MIPDWRRRMLEVYRSRQWPLFLAAVVVIGSVLLAYTLLRIEFRAELDKANAAIAELSKKLETAQTELAERQSELQAIETELENAKRAADQAKAEAIEREKQIVKLNDKTQGIASCEDFFDKWEVTNAPASILAIAGLGREAAAAKDCIEKGDVATACKHWQVLLVQIGRIGPPVSESRGEVKELMRQNKCEAQTNSQNR